MNIDDTDDVFRHLNYFNDRVPSSSLRVSNRIVIEWPYLKTPPQPHDRISAGELGTAVVTTVETMFLGKGIQRVLVELHIVPDASYFDVPTCVKKTAKKKKKRRAE